MPMPWSPDLINREKSPKIFFGWWTVLATGLVSLLGNGFIMLGFSVLFKPIASELGLSRAVASIATGLQSAGQGILAPAGGWASDRYGPRGIILFGIFCLVLGFTMMYFITSLWALLVTWGLIIGAGFTLGCMLITDKAIVNWFVRKSGIAINLKFALVSLSGLSVLPLVAWLITNYGWRVTCLIAGAAIALVGFPLIWFFVKPYPPEHYGLLPDGEVKKSESESSNPVINLKTDSAEDEEPANFTLKQTIKTPAFWVMVGVAYISGLVMPVIGVHCIPFLTDIGISPVKASAMMGLMTTVSIPARLIIGPVIDKMKKRNLRFIMTAGYFLQAVGAAAFLLTRTEAMIYVWFLISGFGGAISFGVQLPMVARYFGRKSFGSILGLWSALNVPVGLIAPIYVGRVYDTTGNYIQAITLLPILLTASGIVACFVFPPKPPKVAIPPAIAI
jgi:MFS transporter, OFA family, oxalate/formate antiporter